MSTEIIASLISSVIGGLMVAVLNYLFMRKKNEAETEKLRAEADKIRAETDKIRAEVKNLNSAIEQADYHSITAPENIIYDGTKGISQQEITGRYELKGEVIISDGGYFELHSYVYNDIKQNYLPKNELLNERKLRVSFEAKVSQGKYSVLFAFRERFTDKRLLAKEAIVEEIEWKNFDLYFKLPSDIDCIMKFSFEPKVEGCIQMRKLMLAESTS
jgi:hypothetical protein